MKNKIFLSLLFVLLISSFKLIAQDFSKGIQLMMNNQYSEAIPVFEKVNSSDKNYSDALLALTLVYLDNDNPAKAYNAFRQFYNSVDNPFPYVYALWNKDIFLFDTEKNRNALKSFGFQMLKDPRLNISMKAMVLSMMGGLYKYENKIDSSKYYYNQINDVRNWSTVGTFQNISSSGFNKSFSVLEHPESDYVFTNNIGAPVKWFNIPDARNDRWLDLEFHYDISNSIIYTQTFVTADEDKDVTMLFGVSGSAKIWINDFLVLSEEEERNTDLDVYAVKVKLQKGNNRILLQIGASEIERSNFMLRFCNEKGDVINLPSTRQYTEYKKAQPYATTRLPFFAEDYFEKKIANNTATVLDKVMLASIYNHNEKHFETRKISEELKKLQPNSILVSEQLIEAYNKDNNTSGETREREFIKSNYPNSLFGLILRYWDAFNKEDYDEAQHLLDKRRTEFGDNEDIEIKQLKLYANKKEIENFLKELDSASAKYKESSTIATMQYSIQQNLYKSPDKAFALLNEYLKNHYNDNLIETLISDYNKAGKTKESLALLMETITDFPYKTMRYENIANWYVQSKDYDKALEWEQKTVDRAPYAGSVYSSKADIYDLAGKKSEATDCYRKAIQYNPRNYEARKKLRLLEGKKDLFSNFKENDISALYKSAPKAEDYPNSNSVYLLKESLNVIYPESGASEERDDYLIKIFNQSGIDTWKEVSVPYNSYTQRLIFDKIEILKKDGSKVQAESNDNQIVFSTLEVGDAIHISYRLENSYYGKLAEHFWGSFEFNSTIPVVLSHMALIVPNNKKFQFKTYNFNLEPKVSTVDDTYKLYEWEQKSNTAIEDESYMPSFADISKKLVYTSIPDWNYVANWYSDLSYNKIKTDFEIKEKVKELLTGKEKLSPVEKAKIIYNYIENNFNYSDVPFLHSAFTPQRASRTLNSKLGDCKDLAVLFTAMAKEASIDANLVLVDTRDEGDNNVTDLPTIDFNHCIAQLKTPSGNYFVELTDNNLPFGCMSHKLINANGLLIPKDGNQTSSTNLVKLNSPLAKTNACIRTTTLALNSDGSAAVQRNVLKTGAETSRTRSSYKDKSEEDRKKEQLKYLSDEFNTKVDLKLFKLSNLNELADTLKTETNFVVSKYSSEIAGMQIVKLPWFDALNSLDFVSVDDRKFSFNVWEYSYAKKELETITITIPEGKKWVEQPKNVSYTSPFITYKLTFVIKQNKLVATREVDYLQDQIKASDYQAFKKIINDINESDKKQYAFK
jgi:Transglutaminase-like enzymes, putative cysteine proteases